MLLCGHYLGHAALLSLAWETAENLVPNVANVAVLLGSAGLGLGLHLPNLTAAPLVFSLPYLWAKQWQLPLGPNLKVILAFFNFVGLAGLAHWLGDSSYGQSLAASLLDAYGLYYS